MVLVVVQAATLLLSISLGGAGAAAPYFGSDFTPTTEDNMNGEYVHSVTPGGKPGLFPQQFKDYPGGVEAYTFYSPAITTRYSQVWWAPLAPIPLGDLTKKYDGKKVVIVGWEIDQVRKTAAGDVSVPITASYNHHYGKADRFPTHA